MAAPRSSPSRLPIPPGHLLRAAGLLVALAAAFVAFRSFDLGAVLAALEHADPIWLLPIVVVLAAQLLLRAARLRTLLARPAGGRGIGLGSLVSAMLVALLVNNVSPARVGDGVKCYLVSRQHRLPFTGVLGVLMLEHGLDSASLAVVAAAGLMALGIGGPVRTLGLIAGAAGLAVLAAMFVADLPALGRRVRARRSGRVASPLVRRLVEGLAHFGAGFTVVGRRRVALIALAIGLLAWACDGLTFWLVGRSLGLALSPAGAVLITAAVALASILPGAPGYVGTLELAAVTAAGMVGIVGPGALALALVFHLVQLVPMSAAGLLAVALGGHRVEPAAGAETTEAGEAGGPAPRSSGPARRWALLRPPATDPEAPLRPAAAPTVGP